ncbi:MAG: cellulase family glycosylhydrolase [Bacteroidales bacterium]|nr:cellulase family glycosylhydrolase [Bacteroidales bacterium]
MKTRFCCGVIIVIVLVITSCKNEYQPLSLHPGNNHYFLFREKPTVLIGSTEHYGAVMNLDFDYIKYLDELASYGLNITRTFSGIYVEPQGAFNISKNTLAPQQGRYICPWARSNEPGYPGGGNKFDLTKWDPGYFARLKDFISEAGKRNIVVELDLFSNFYDTIQWKLSPLYYSNNVNGFKPVKDHREVLSLRHPRLLKIQEDMVKKILEECNSFDNLYYEVCNEPYFGDKEALDAWEEHMTGIIEGIEKGLPRKHLISQNIENFSLKVENPHPAVSIFNFHYAQPPVTVEMNYGLNKPVGDNETGFRGIEDVHYRTEGWDFMTAGGALYNNLDYSFTTDNEDGSFQFPATQPGGGGAKLRSQLSMLKSVFGEIDFIKMKPVNYSCKPVLPEKATVRILAEEGRQYLVYINNWHPQKEEPPLNENLNQENFRVPVELPSGNYSCEWIDPVTGRRTKLIVNGHEGGEHEFIPPSLTEDIVLLIKKQL